MKMKTNDIEKIELHVSVAGAKGSWKWQTPYHRTTYRATLLPQEGRIVWRVAERLGKISRPQLIKTGKIVGYPIMPGQNNKPVPRQYVDGNLARYLERHGYRFEA